MNRKSLSLVSLGTLAFVSSAFGAQRPNLLVIHTDEHNFRTLSCYQDQLPEAEAFVWGKGCNSKTPNIDRIGNEGAICMKYYCAAPVSTPSRASFLTGNYSQETGAFRNELPIDRKMATFGSILRDNGYATSYVGKWHLAGTPEKYTFGVEYNGGFSDNRFMMNKGHSPFFELDKDGKVITAISQKQVSAAKAKGHTTIHMTDYFTDKTLEILKRDKDKPFCVMVSIPDPHTPDYARSPFYEMYKEMKPTMPITMEPQNAKLRPLWALSKKNEPATFNPEPLKHYFGMVSHIDHSIGKMLDFLEAEGILDNTIVVFTSDHGDMFYEHKRMNKGNPYEASARIPFVMRYPKKIKKGTVIEKAYVNIDFTPTILSLMDIKTNLKFSGDDDSADFTKGVKNVDDIAVFAASGSEWIAAADSRFKLVLATKCEPWLVDLKNDAMELNNLYGNPKYSKDAKRLAAQIKARLKSNFIVAKGTTFQFGNL